MEKRNKKILLLSIFGGAAVLMFVGYVAFLIWAVSKISPVGFKENAARIFELFKCQNSTGADEKCVKEWVQSLVHQKHEAIDKKREKDPEYNACMYEQEVLLEALKANKQQSEEVTNREVAHFCDYKMSPATAINDTDIYSDYTALKLLKNDLASQAILNYRYKAFKKKNYPLELEALDVYRKLVNAADCASLEKDFTDLDKRGSVFVLGSIAVCKMQGCIEAKKTNCPEAVKIGERMNALGDIAGNFVLSYEAGMSVSDKQGLKALNYARQALLNGYTDLAPNYPELEEDDFYKIKFTSDSLAFSAARLMNAEKVYTPALNCVAASLNKDWEFETLLKTPQTYSKEQWKEKITGWANDNSDLMVRVACEVLTDVESKKRLQEFYMNDGNEDGSTFNFCKMIQDPLFKEVCAKEAPKKTNKETTERD